MKLETYGVNKQTNYDISLQYNFARNRLARQARGVVLKLFFSKSSVYTIAKNIFLCFSPYTRINWGTNIAAHPSVENTALAQLHI